MDEQKLKAIISDACGNNRDQRPPSVAERISSYIKENSFFPEEKELLVAVAEAIDSESDQERAWELIDHPERTGLYSRGPEWPLQLKAVSKCVHRSTVSYFNQSNQESTSGVLVDIGGRIFVATTAHSLKRKVNEIFLVGHEFTEDCSPVLNYGRGTSERLDVAYLEVDSQEPQRIIKSPISLDRISICGCGLPNRLTVLFGFPSKLAKTARDNEGFEITLKGQFWPFPVLQPAHWNTLPESTSRTGPPDESLDIFMAYPQEAEVDALSSSKGATTRLSEPDGLSGGGYWISTNQEGQPWFPENYKLFAIQSRWWGLGRYLQGVQIVYWLALVWLGQPELRDVIETTFPETDFESYARIFISDA